MKSAVIHRYLMGQASAGEREAILLWVEESSENRELLQYLSKIYDSAIWLSDDIEGFIKAQQPKAVGPAEAMAPERYNGRFLKSLIKIAAVFLIGIFLSALLYHLYGTGDMQILTTGNGQQTELVLEDGTHVWLNSASSLTYPSRFSLFSRKVVLKGEAYFKVIHNKLHPFHVESFGNDIQVLGTEFNVRAYNEAHYEVALVKGALRLTDAKAREIMMQPGEVVSFNPERGVMKKELVHDPEYYKWTSGIIRFRQKPLSDIFRLLSRIYRVHISCRRSLLLNEHYTGKILINDGLEHALNVLKMSSKFDYVYTQNQDSIDIR